MRLPLSKSKFFNRLVYLVKFHKPSFLMRVFLIYSNEYCNGSVYK